MKFTAEQVKDLIDCNEIDSTAGEARRWSSTETSIIKYEDKFYELYWECGCAELQDNEYEAQDAPEVHFVEKIITKTVVSWEKVNV